MGLQDLTSSPLKKRRSAFTAATRFLVKAAPGALAFLALSALWAAFALFTFGAFAAFSAFTAAFGVVPMCDLMGRTYDSPACVVDL